MKEIQVTIARELVFKNGKVFAYAPKLNDYEEINGCDYFKYRLLEKEELEFEEKRLKEELEKLEIKKEINRKEILDLEINGYCPIDEVAYTRVGGVVTGEYLTHRKICKHKGE